MLFIKDKKEKVKKIKEGKNIKLEFNLDKSEDLETFFSFISNICIIFAKPRTGKTSLMTAIANACTFYRPFLLQQHNAIRELNAGGFNIPLTDTVCVSNYYMCFSKFGYRPRFSYHLNPFRYGYSNEKRDMAFILPYSKIFITEGQKYLDSHISMAFEAFQSRAYEQCGHIDLNLFIDVQRPDLINANVREIACFIEVVYKEDIKDGYIWHLKYISDSTVLKQYINSGKAMELPEFTIKYMHNVFSMYNSQVYKPKFFDGHYKNEGLLHKAINYDMSVQGFKMYNQVLDDELPVDKGS